MSLKSLLILSAFLAVAACKANDPNAICDATDDETNQTICAPDNGPQDASPVPTVAVPDTDTGE